MGTTSVVVSLLLGQGCPQVPLAEDQHSVGELRPGRKHEPLRMGIGTHRQRHPIQMIGTDVSG